MSFSHFSDEQVVEIWRAAVETGVAADAEADVLSDLRRLNAVERLADGRVPIIAWLEAAAAQTMALPRGYALRLALDRAAARMAGEPLLTDPSKFPEFQEVIGRHEGALDYSFLAAGQAAGAAVAQLRVPRFDGGRDAVAGGVPAVSLGVGCLVAPDLLLTNHHVLNARRGDESNASPKDLHLQAGGTVARFGPAGGETPRQELNVVRLEAWDARLDYGVVRLARPAERTPLRPGRVRVERPPGGYVPVNSIHCAESGARQLVIRNSLVSGSTETDLRYFTHTRPISSGAPIFDDGWHVVALRRGSVVAEGVRYMGSTTAWLNVATHVASILEHLKANHPPLWSELAGAARV